MVKQKRLRECGGGDDRDLGIDDWSEAVLERVPKSSLGTGVRKRNMKKLMFAAAAGICASVFGAGEITSANIVGYMGKDMAVKGYYNYSPMFVGVGGTNPAVNSIVPSTNDPEVEDLGYGVIMLYVLDTNRKFAKTFAYKTVDGDWMDEDGWYFGDDEQPTDYKLAPGESLQVYAPYQVTFTYSGEVDMGAYDFTAPANGYYMVGNQHATKLAVNSIVPSTEDPTVEDLGYGVNMLYVLDTDRKFAKTFAYKTADGDWMDSDGWYYGDEETPTTYELEPGEVLQLYSAYQLKLAFPAQEIK